MLLSLTVDSDTRGVVGFNGTVGGFSCEKEVDVLIPVSTGDGAFECGDATV